MADCCSFLRFPRELRDSIYEYYFHCKGGYVFNYDAGKLRTASGDGVDLALRLTCHLVANETRGLALKHNTLYSLTVYRDDIRETLDLFTALLDFLVHHKSEILQDAGNEGCLGKTACAGLKTAYTDLQPIIDYLTRPRTHTNPYPVDLKLPVEDALAMAGQQLGLASTLTSFRHHRDIGGNCGNAVSLSYDPWIIPTADDISKLLQAGCLLDPNNGHSRYFERTRKYFHCKKYRLSPASVVIHFLRSLLPTTRH